MTKKLAIIGAGGLGRETLALVRQSNLVRQQWDVVGFFDDNQKRGDEVAGARVLGALADVGKDGDLMYVMALGNPSAKERLARNFKTGLAFATLIHPKAVVADTDRVRIGPGTILTAGAVLTIDIRLGDHVLVNLNATVGHDSVIGNFASIMPGVNIAGSVSIGNAVLVGSGATIINKAVIGDHARIGAGAVVTKAVPSGVTVVGVPARILK